IATFNTLRNPYISDNPADQLGNVQGTRVLQVATSIGLSTATLVNVQDLFRDQRILFDSDLSRQTLTVVSVNRDTQVVTFAETFQFAFPTSSVLTVYNPSYDLLGRVLRTGDIVFVLSDDLAGSQGTLLERIGSPDQRRLYGQDLHVLQGALTIAEGDLGLV